MIDVPIPKYASDYDGYMLAKFTSELKYQQDFLDGKIYFNTSDFFASCDKEGIGDYTESQTLLVRPTPKHLVTGELKWIDGKVHIVYSDYTSESEKYPGLMVADFSTAENRNRKILSLYTTFVNINENRIAPFSDKMKKRFGKYTVLILERQEFFSRVFTALLKETQNTDTRLGFVVYKTAEEMQGFIDWKPFMKPYDHDYENEFRITFINDNDLPKTLELDKDIRDIAVPISAEKLYSEMYLEDGKLYYPIEDKEVVSCPLLT